MRRVATIVPLVTAALVVAVAPASVAAVAEPRCSGASLALAQTADVVASSIATATFTVRDLGAPCVLPRVAIVHAFDAAGSDIPLTAEKVRELDVILKIRLQPDAAALFTITYTPAGNGCTRAVRVRFAVGDGGIESPASFLACTGPGGADAHVSFLMGPTSAHR
jgi:hypothetical protein